MPTFDFFFNKKRRDIVKRETHQKEGVTIKWNKVQYDGQALEEAKFATEMAGSFEDLSTKN
jgi:hypothetical protein